MTTFLFAMRLQARFMSRHASCRATSSMRFRPAAARRFYQYDPRWSSNGQTSNIRYELQQYARTAPVYALIAANVGIWAWYNFYAVNSPTWKRWFSNRMVLSNSRVKQHPYVMLTHMFTHMDLWHLGANMITLWSFGSSTLEMLGPARFMGLYFASGLAGGAAHLAYSRYMPGTDWPAAYTVRRDQPAIGASAAIAGLTMYTATRVWQGTTILFIIPVPNPLFVLLFVGGSAYYALMDSGYTGNFAHSAHLGGAAVGMGYAIFRTLMRR